MSPTRAGTTVLPAAAARRGGTTTVLPAVAASRAGTTAFPGTAPTAGHTVVRAAAFLLTALFLVSGCGNGEPEDATPDRAPEHTEPASPAEASPPPPGAGAPAGAVDPAVLRRDLQEGDARARMFAAARLSDADTVPARERVAWLVEALEAEIDRPTAESLPVKTFLEPSDWMRYHFTRALAAQGPDGIEELLRIAREEDGEVAQRAAIALGEAGVPEAVPLLRAALREAEHFDVRTDAAYLLGELRASEAVPDLEAALEDPHVLEVEERGRRHSFYPVREHAQGALEKIRGEPGT
jgi:hypothetical protein